jgi:Pectinacetylesterase
MLRYVDLKWILPVLLGLYACGDSDASGDRSASPEPSAVEADAGSVDAATPTVPVADLQELLDLGITKYLGAAKPSGMETISGVEGVADGSLVYDFDPADGPVCLRGARYQVSVLDQKSENLMIYLQGGGACVSAICQASTEPTPRGVPTRGILDSKDTQNPVAGWNVLYVPYCDGSVFGGDADFTNPSDAMGKRYHHGQRNFAAALDVALTHFPNPKKVLLAGSSAGGWGTVYHRGLVRSQYPMAELTVVNDAGIGFAVNQPAVADEWGATRHRPPSCVECQTHPHMSYFVRYMLAHDPGTWVGDFSSYGDSVIRRFTFSPDAAAFKEQLLQETSISAQAFPDRYKRFFIQGESHTALQSAFHTAEINGVTVAQWVGKMINRDPSWSDLLAP